MRDRRPLIEGLKAVPPVDRRVEEQFVFAGKAKENGSPTEPRSSAPDAETRKGKEASPGVPGRVPLTTRVRSDYATALKRASLERQLSGTQPNTLQDILEEALEPWLRANGYLPQLTD